MIICLGGQFIQPLFCCGCQVSVHGAAAAEFLSRVRCHVGWTTTALRSILDHVTLRMGYRQSGVTISVSFERCGRRAINRCYLADTVGIVCFLGVGLDSTRFRQE